MTIREEVSKAKHDERKISMVIIVKRLKI